jgi:hypothetical protein
MGSGRYPASGGGGGPASAVTLSDAGVAGKTAGGSGDSGTLGFAALAAAEASADVSTTTLSGTASSIAVSGLDGDADGDYLLYFHLKSAGGATGAPKLQINDADTNLYSHWVSITGASTVAGSRSATTCDLGASLASGGNSASGWILLRSRRTSPTAWRSGHAEVNSETGPAGYFINIIYTDNTTNITKLSIVANTNSLASGSFLTVRKLRNPS